jgi:uncharacterized protein DUF29
VSHIDPKRLAEELESLGQQDQREVEGLLHALLYQLLKWWTQLEERCGRWASAIHKQRHVDNTVVGNDACGIGVFFGAVVTLRGNTIRQNRAGGSFHLEPGHGVCAGGNPFGGISEPVTVTIGFDTFLVTEITDNNGAGIFLDDSDGLDHTDRQPPDRLRQQCSGGSGRPHRRWCRTVRVKGLMRLESVQYAYAWIAPELATWPGMEVKQQVVKLISRLRPVVRRAWRQ